MKRLNSQEIKKIILGVSLSDGHIESGKYRFELYSKHEEYCQYINQVLLQITGVETSFRVKHDKRGYTGYRIFTKKHQYFKKMYEKIYNGRKNLTQYNVSRIDELALSHIWMCDGFLEHAKNRKINKVQNIGWLCFEAFPKEELEILQKHLLCKFGIESVLVKVIWGYGNRIKISGMHLQKLISIVYPYILDCFKYKTPLFYKTLKRVNMDLPNAEQYIQIYECVEDIVRHPMKIGKTV